MRALARRLLHAGVVVLAVATITFVLLQLAPGDPFTSLAESRYNSPEIVAQMRRNFGLDRPWYVQYVRYLGNLAQGNLGMSFTQHRPVLEALRETVPNTLILAVAALIIDFTVGIALGTWQATRAHSRLDHALSALSLTAFSVPRFWLGLLLLIVFGQVLRWFPAGGMTDAVSWPFLSPTGRAADVLHHLVLPALTLGLVGAAQTARYQRAALLEVVRQDFLRTARAKGLTERAVLLHHALRNALLPAITLFGLSLPTLLAGSVLVETVFAWPGMGWLSADAVTRRDYPMVTGAAIAAAVMVVLGSLVADGLTRWADPRTRAT